MSKDGPSNGGETSWLRQTVAAMHDYAFAPQDAIVMRTFRFVFGLCLFAYVCDRALTPYEWLTDAGFHYSVDVMDGSRPVPAPLLPPRLVPWFVGALLSAIALFTVGLFGRWSALGSLVLLLYASLADLEASFTLNLLFHLGLFVFAILPPTYSIESKGRVIEAHSAWPVRVLQLTLVIQYAAAGWCKLIHGDWQLGNTDVLWTHVQGFYLTEVGAWIVRTLPKWSWTVMQYGALLFELLAPILFLVPPLRRWGIIIGIVFHGLVAVMMYKLIYFSAQMVSFYVLFVEGETWRRWLRPLLSWRRE